MKNSLYSFSNLGFLGVLLAAPLFLSTPSLAGNNDPALKEAQDLTRKLLTDPETREREGLNNADAKAAHQKILDLTGSNSQQTEAIYGISADAFQDITNRTKGDTSAILDILTKAQKDPKAFFQSLSPDQQARIKTLGAEIDKGKTKSP
jgi:hypothetical protein